MLLIDSSFAYKTSLDCLLYPIHCTLTLMWMVYCLFCILLQHTVHFGAVILLSFFSIEITIWVATGRRIYVCAYVLYSYSPLMKDSVELFFFWLVIKLKCLLYPSQLNPNIDEQLLVFSESKAHVMEKFLNFFLTPWKYCLSQI